MQLLGLSMRLLSRPSTSVSQAASPIVSSAYIILITTSELSSGPFLFEFNCACSCDGEVDLARFAVEPLSSSMHDDVLQVSFTTQSEGMGASSCLPSSLSELITRLCTAYLRSFVLSGDSVFAICNAPNVKF